MTALEVLDKNFDNLVEVIQKAVSYDTTRSQPQPGAPFGKNIKQCLTYILGVAKEMGFTVYDCDGYAGHADMKGKGDEVLGILGHIDVVPAKEEDGWIHPPFAGVIEDDKLYGRGTVDDKGPIIACLFAMKALKDSGFVPNKTIRIIFGCDEESGMECVKHYFETVPKPNIAFSPDSDFPVINREKGIFQFGIDFGKLNGNILDIQGGDRVNVVTAKCTAVITDTVKPVVVDGVEVVHNDDNTYTLTAHGKAAHGSKPQEGVNANWAIFRSLALTFPFDTTLAFISQKMCDYTGSSLGIDMRDEHSGQLTCSMNVVSYTDNKLQVMVDVRFPVSFSCEQFYSRLTSALPYEVTVVHTAEPLFVKQDSFLVSTLLDVYNMYTDSYAQPIAIGGGTYSRSLPNCVAFGPLFPDEEETIHMPNENIDLNSLRQMTEIYCEAIRRLAE